LRRRHRFCLRLSCAGEALDCTPLRRMAAGPTKVPTYGYPGLVRLKSVWPGTVWHGSPPRVRCTDAGALPGTVLPVSANVCAWAKEIV